MANSALFNSTRGPLLPAADTLNQAGGSAYAMPPEQMLAQYAATGCMNSTFYATGADQLNTVLTLCRGVEPEFIARTALYCRREGRMKDMPALLCAVLSVRSPGLLAELFDRVMDSPKMLRTFVQIMRSGVVGRKSLGTLPKRLILQWLERQSDETIFFGSVGRNPSMADIIRMVHPRPATPARAALYGYLLGREVNQRTLPECIRAFEAYKTGQTSTVPNVPFQMLTSLDIGTEGWKSIARNGSWQMTRMNLNTYVRHGVLEDKEMVRIIATRLKDPAAIAQARALPYQLLTARTMTSHKVPNLIRGALESALEASISNVPELPGRTYVFLDVSGSMHSPVTGYREGSTTAVSCLDVAALMAAAVLRRNPDAGVIPFHSRIEKVDLDPHNSVTVNAKTLRNLPNGGTNCAAPMAELNRLRASVDMVIYVSDNQSWLETTPRMNGTQTMQEWAKVKARNPEARMVCIDLQPYGNTQAPDRPDTLNVGGFSDAVFEVIRQFASGEQSGSHWTDMINRQAI